MREEDAYYPYFDYVRAIAAFGVFAAHADGLTYLPEHLGNACVQVFFALSGFLIGGILLRSKIDDLPRFYFNRATRIWIPYAIAIALLAFATAVKQGFHDPKFVEFFFYYITFVYNWFGPPQLADSVHHMPLDGTANHFWSICVEEQFYLLAPLAIRFLPRIGLLASLTVASALSPDYFLAISLGVVLAITGPRTALVIASAGIGILAEIAGSYILAVSFLSVALIGILARQGRQTLFGKIAGGASFSLYLNHWIGLFLANAFLKKLHFPYSIAITFGFIVMVGLSIAHYLFIDQNIALHRSKWFSRQLGGLLCALAFFLVTIGMLGALFVF